MPRKIEDNWIKEYLRYTEEQESPEMFHFWVAVSLISAVLARKVYIDLGYFKKYPNLYVVLVAGSQKCRKSTAINIGVDILRDMEEGHPHILSQKMTPEALIQALQDQAIESRIVHGKTARATGMIVADEISTYLDKTAIQRGMIPMLLKMHDCADPFEYHTKGQGLQKLPKSYLTMLAGSAPEYLPTSFPAGEVGGGMLARTILVYQQYPKSARPIPIFGDKQHRLRENLLNDIQHIAQIEGAFKLSDLAFDWYEKWYIQWHDNDDWYQRDSSLEHYYNKKPDHLLALAQIISIAEDDELIIEKEHLTKALALLDDTEKTMHLALGHIVSEGIGMNIKLVAETVNRLFTSGIRPNRMNILKQLYKRMDAEEMSRCLLTLTQAGMMKQEQDSATNEYFYVPIK